MKIRCKTSFLSRNLAEIHFLLPLYFRKGILGMVFLFMNYILVGQTPAYLHYGMPEGLPGNTVYCGLQDRQGDFGFGTDKGLVRFDGIRFTVFDMNAGLPDPEVLELYLDRQDRLWIFCFQQMPCYRQNGRIITFKEDSRLNMVVHPITDIWEDTNWGLWFSFGFATYRWHNENIAEIPTNGLGFGLLDSRMFIFSLKHIEECLPGGELVQSFVFPHDLTEYGYKGLAISGNRILMVFNRRRLLLEFQNGRFEILADQKASGGAVLSDSRGRFWVCPETGGVICFNNTERNLDNPVEYLKGQHIGRAFEDRFGAFWFCTEGNGIYTLLPETPTVLNPAKTNITTLAQDGAGRILYGDNTGMIAHWQPKAGDPVHVGINKGFNRIRQIIPDYKGGCLVATDHDIFFSRANGAKRIGTGGSIKGFILKNDSLWYGSSNRIAVIDLATYNNYNYRFIRVTTLGIDGQRNLWIGAINGLYSNTDNFTQNWAEKFPELNGRITSIAQSGDTALWLATPRRGLMHARVKDGKITSVKVINDHLLSPVHNINHIYPEPHCTWLATNCGVYAIWEDGRVFQFGYQDGLASDDVNAVLVKNDTLWAATTGGLSRVILKNKTDTPDFPIRIVGIRYYDGVEMRHLDFLDTFITDHQTELPENASAIRFELSAPYYRTRGQLRFQCCVQEALPSILWWTPRNLMRFASEGFRSKPDTLWSDDGVLELGVQLPSGLYKIQVNAVTAGNIWSEKPASWTIFKKPLWYNTIWVYLIGILGVLVVILRYQTARIANRKLHSALSGMQLQALKAQINPHFIGNSINALQQFFYPPDPYRASEYIAVFNRLLRRTLEYSEKNFIPFSEEVEYDTDYLSMIQLRLGERFEFEVEGASAINPKMPFPSMLLQPILENATMHGLSEDGISRLKVAFYLRDNLVVCSVTDNGAGIKAVMEKRRLMNVKRFSKGMEMVRQKATILQHLYQVPIEIEVTDLAESTPKSKGTQVVIKIDINILNSIIIEA